MMGRRTWIRTSIRIFLGLLFGLLASGAFLIVAFRFWESLVMPFPLLVTETRRTVIFFVEISIYCITGLLFGVVNSLFVPKEWGDLQAIIGGVLALVVLLPFMFIEGHFVPGMVIIPLAIAAACGFFIRAGQLIVFRFRKSE
jgi:hypothetical protein